MRFSTFFPRKVVRQNKKEISLALFFFKIKRKICLLLLLCVGIVWISKKKVLKAMKKNDLAKYDEWEKYAKNPVEMGDLVGKTWVFEISFLRFQKRSFPTTFPLAFTRVFHILFHSFPPSPYTCFFEIKIVVSWLKTTIFAA